MVEQVRQDGAQVTQNPVLVDRAYPVAQTRQKAGLAEEQERQLGSQAAGTIIPAWLMATWPPVKVRQAVAVQVAQLEKGHWMQRPPTK